jgi:hypothetical protein
MYIWLSASTYIQVIRNHLINPLIKEPTSLRLLPVCANQVLCLRCAPAGQPAWAFDNRQTAHNSALSPTKRHDVLVGHVQRSITGTTFLWTQCDGSEQNSTRLLGMKFHIVHVMKMFRLFYELRETKTHIAPMGEDAHTYNSRCQFLLGGRLRDFRFPGGCLIFEMKLNSVRIKNRPLWISKCNERHLTRVAKKIARAYLKSSFYLNFVHLS